MLSSSLILALREIRRHLLRSFLTILGIVIGVAAVITMVTIGRGATAAVVKEISSLGANLLMVEPGRGQDAGAGAAPHFQPQDIDAVREQISGLRAVAAQVHQSGVAVRNAQSRTSTVNGITNDYLDAQNWPLSRGRLFTPAEEQAGSAVCIIGAAIVRTLFRDDDPMGQRFRIGDVSCEVIGVLVARGQAGFGEDRDGAILMPLKTVQRRFTGARDIHSFIVAINPAYATSDVKAALTTLLRERRHLPRTKPDNFIIVDTKQIIDAVSGTTRVMTALLGAVAAVSLVVGGIGIMNIMLVSVTERTREIGIRLAIGAMGREVLLQFLVEAIFLACLGGLLGMALALAVTVALAPAMNIPFIFDPIINIASFAFSGLIGIIFGYAPARRAAKLNPIDALRHE